MPRVNSRFLAVVFALLFSLPPFLASSALALQPDEIALIVNSNEPRGRELANFYAQARHIPDNRILELNLTPSDDLPFKVYEEQVVPQVREFLRTGHLEQQVKCFVTFYGVPIRIAARVSTPADSTELERIKITLNQTVEKIIPPVKKLEALAAQLDAQFAPTPGDDLDQLSARADRAMKVIRGQMSTIADPRRQLEVGADLLTALEPLLGASAKVQHDVIEARLHPATQPATQQAALQAMADQYTAAIERAKDLEQRRFDPKARDELRHVVAKNFGLLQWIKLLRDQADYLDPKETTAAFDSELAMVRWTVYPRVRWCENPLYYAAKRQAINMPTYMVTRLDAPTTDQVKRIISDSIKAETDGLKGKVVLDSRGLLIDKAQPTERGLAEYDESIRDLGHLIRKHTKLAVLADDNPDPLPANSADDVALYCGWYSLRHYIPECKFNPGAVGYHIASFEMLTLHGPGEQGWVPGLINDGIAATLGPVAEPFVQLFPKPADFFPLLLTGKLTLAEVYWRTTPAASWMLGLIGDPLYTPYKNNPQLQASDLPDRLRPMVSTTTQPIAAEK
ncbi:MAG TPA: TIGR03790 family protein [Tepidisphaeraceae bacterium]|nr:TIGR03790 family protein [Tepidisphaeraceae bacterium]